MSLHEELNPKQWWSIGNVFKDKLLCQYIRGISSRGFWYGDDPLSYPTPLILVQISLIFFTTRAVFFILQPLRQSMTVAQILAGLIIGPSVLGRIPYWLSTYFPPPASYVLKTIASFGFMLQMFISGVMIDMSAIRKSGPKSILIAFSGVFFSLMLGALAFFFLRTRFELDQSLFSGIRIMIVFNSLTFFMVTSSYLHDLKIINSEMGRLASSSSLVIDIFGLLTTTFGLIWLSPTTNPNLPPKWMTSISISLYYLVLFCGFRPLILSIVRRTPEGMPMKQTHFLVILAIVMVSWHWGERVGQRFSAFLFGLSLPHGPPLGSALVQKLELFTSGVLLPLFCSMNGLRIRTKYLAKSPYSMLGVEIILVLGQIGKFLGTVGSSVAVGVSLEDAVPLGFMMTFKGIMEIATFAVWKDQKLLDDRLYSLAMLNIVFFTGIAFPLTQWLYDPSSKYNTVRKRKVMGLGDHADLQVLVCIHNEDNMPAMFDILEVSKFNKSGGSISVFALQLIQLKGSAIPILAPLHEYKKKADNFGLFDHVVNALEQFEQDCLGYARVQQFVSVTPSKSMHNDICTLAHDKRTSLIIVPFHKKWGIDGNVESSDQQLRSINRRILRESPCSVAILISKVPSEQGAGMKGLDRFSINSHQTYQIVTLFVGGTDDHEALALTRRMAEHPNVRLTVIWLKDPRPYETREVQEDMRVMREFHMKSKGHERICVREKIVEDGIGTTKAVLSLENTTDLFVVGRYHEEDCAAIQGLGVWSDSPEIGSLADTLVSSNSRVSILVVQQQPRVDWKLNGSKNSRDYDFAVSIDSPKSNTSLRSRIALGSK
ncbi:unnamed protein product [Amaranthus hypochondriacus]